MGRFARAVAVGCPHDVTQRGNFRRDVYFEDLDRQTNLDLLAASESEARLPRWGQLPHVQPRALDRGPRAARRNGKHLPRCPQIGAPDFVAELETKLNSAHLPQKRGISDPTG